MNFSEEYIDPTTKNTKIRCTLCDLKCDTYEQFRSHSSGKKHQNRIPKGSNNLLNHTTDLTNVKVLPESNDFNCVICKVLCNTKEQLESHNKGQKHIKKASKDLFTNTTNTVTVISESPADEHSTERSNEISNENGNILNSSSSISDIKEIETSTKSLTISPGILQLLKPLQEGNWITCQLCNIRTNTDEQYRIHCNGSSHQKRVKNLNIPNDIVDQGDVDDQLETCITCNIKIHKNNIKSHNEGKLHRDKLIKSKSVGHVKQAIRKSNLSVELQNINLFQFPPRKYQQEIYEKALINDCVVFLPTGTGKTYIGAMLILKMLEENPFHRIAFLVDKVLLVMQQVEFFKDQFENINLKRFTSENESETRELRLIALANDLTDTDHICSVRDHDVIVSTAKLFENLLDSGILSWSDLSLVVLDEAHNCVKGHPYNKLLNQYHLHPKHVATSDSCASLTNSQAFKVDENELQQWKDQRCKIVGLTASPSGDLSEDNTYESLKTLLESLGGVEIATVTDNLVELEEFTSFTNIESKLVEYDKNELELRNIICGYFTFLLKRYERLVNGIGNSILSNFSQLSIEDVSNLKSQLNNFLTELSDIQKAVVRHILNLVEIIEAIDSNGFGIAFKIYTDLINNSNEMVWFKDNLLELSKNSEQFPDANSNATSSLVNTIVEECKSVGNENRTILLLVKERKIAREWNELFKGLLEMYDIRLLLGHGGKSSKKKSKGMSVSQQKKALDEIRKHSNQIIIATSVANEGVDLPECDLVIIINPPNSVTAFVQIRGRARKHNSRLLMICRDQVSIDNLDQLKVQEKNIKQSIMKLLNESVSN